MGFFFGVFVFRRLRERDGTNVVGFLFFVVSFRRPGVVDVGVTGGRDRSIGTRRVTPGVRSEAIRFLIRTDLAPGHLLLLVVVVVDVDVDVAIVRVSRRKGTARNGKSKNYKQKQTKENNGGGRRMTCSVLISVFFCLFVFFFGILFHVLHSARNVRASALQIRQEKPYYIADPEVDSLVSTPFVFCFCCVSVLWWHLVASVRSRPPAMTAKNPNENRSVKKRPSSVPMMMRRR